MAKDKSESAVDRMELDIKAKASGSAQSFDRQVEAWLDSGVTESEIMDNIDAMDDIGRGPFAELAKGAVDSAVQASTTIIAVDTARELAGGDGSAMGTWMSTGGDTVCDGCAALHGKEMSLEEFEATHGTNECGERCYCYWVPDQVEKGEGPVNLASEDEEQG
jgi:hypothetical protein